MGESATKVTAEVLAAAEKTPTSAAPARLTTANQDCPKAASGMTPLRQHRRRPSHHGNDFRPVPRSPRPILNEAGSGERAVQGTAYIRISGSSEGRSAAIWRRAQGVMMNVIVLIRIRRGRARKWARVMSIQEIFPATISFGSYALTRRPKTSSMPTRSTMKDASKSSTARGGIINEKHLIEALKSGKVGGAAFDVFEEEPVKPDHPLLSLENFICTPHIGASTTEAQENVAVGIAEQIVDYLTRGIARGAVNVPSVPADLLPRLQPYITLAEKLGLLQSQLYEGGIERVTVEYKGECCGRAPLTSAALKAADAHP